MPPRKPTHSQLERERVFYPKSKILEIYLKGIDMQICRNATDRHSELRKDVSQNVFTFLITILLNIMFGIAGIQLQA
jgi:hypothetical protein